MGGTRLVDLLERAPLAGRLVGDEFDPCAVGIQVDEVPGRVLDADRGLEVGSGDREAIEHLEAEDVPVEVETAIELRDGDADVVCAGGLRHTRVPTGRAQKRFVPRFRGFRTGPDIFGWFRVVRTVYGPRRATGSMLTFIGLGLYDERSITVEGREALRDADRAFAERYTSHLVGASLDDLEAHHGVPIEVREREGVERDPEPILAAAEGSDVVFLTAGDTMVSTTHVDLRLRARDRGIETRVIHGVTAQTAASSLTGLQNYRFGRATTLPFPYAHGADGLPESVTEAIDDNRERGLHTVVYLDIKVGQEARRSPNVSWDGDDAGELAEYMTADVAASLLAAEYPDVVGVAVARAGSPDPLVAAAPLSDLADREFGAPLHLLVVPGECHPIEAEALVELAGATRDVLDTA